MNMKSRVNELFKQEKYEEGIKVIKNEFVKLFKDMLDFKNVSYNDCSDFEYLCAEIPFSYPQYSDLIILMENILMDPGISYVGLKKYLFKMYENMEKTYKKETDYSEDMWSFDE